MRSAKSAGPAATSPPVPLRQTSLKWQILLASGATLLLLMLLIGLASLFILWPSYQQIEQSAAESDLLRLERAMQRSQQELEVLAADWANWDDTYQFLQGENPRYLDSNMVALTFANARLHSILLYDLQGRLVWGGSLDADQHRLLPATDPLTARTGPLLQDEEHSGLTSVGSQVLMYTWTRVTDSRAIMPTNGWLVMLRALDDEQLQRLRKQIDLDNLDMQQVPGPLPATPHLSSVLDERYRNNQLWLPLAGSDDALQLSFISPRAITRLASDSLRTGGLLVLAAILCCLLVIWWLLQRRISLPLARLADAVTRLGEKPDTLQELHPLALRSDEIGTLTREVRQMHLRILSLSNLDPLTGLPNRRQFDQTLTGELLVASKGHPFSLCFIDLDGFKPVNDQYGHETGDHLLQELARRMNGLLREHDHLARIGGDEFVLMLDNVYSPELVRPILERLLERIRQTSRINGHAIEIDASIGVASFPRDARNVQDLLQRADLAMYHSKQQGGGRVTFASEIAGEDTGIADSTWQHKRHLYSQPPAASIDQPE